METLVVDNLLPKIALIGALGVAAQWAAWRFHIPAIVLLAAAGLIAGPGLRALPFETSLALDPAMDFGPFLQPLIAVAVAVILFEGGLSLNFREIEGVSKAVRRLVFPGAIVAWFLGAMAAHFVAGLGWPVAILFSGILIVTGPTVIAPLLRQARLKSRPSALLKWEGIINDPIGALFAVIAYEGLIVFTGEHGPWMTGMRLVFASIAAIGFGILGAQALAAAFRRGFVAEFLKAPIMFASVLAIYALAESVEHETGLIAVTAMGVALANSRIASIQEMRRFKEQITILLVSSVFVILTASLKLSDIQALGPAAFAFVAVMLFLVRPASVSLSTAFSDINWRERALIGWISPRGVVAAAVSGLFAEKLTHLEFADPELTAQIAQDAAMMKPLAFAIIFATVIAHGFSIRPFGRRLGLASSSQPGVLIVGASPWSAALADALMAMDIKVLVADASWKRLRAIRQIGAPCYYGEILSEVTDHHIELNEYGVLLAVSGNEAYNALLCTDLAHEMGRASSFQLMKSGDAHEDEDPRGLPHTLKGRPLFERTSTLFELLRRHYAGWTFQRTKLSDAFTIEDYTSQLHEDAEILLIQKPSGLLQFRGGQSPMKPEAGDSVLAFGPAKDKSKDNAQGEAETSPIAPNAN